MAYTKASNKAVQRYNKKTYSNITVRVKKGEKTAIKKFAEAQGMSLNAYINKLIAEDMSRAATDETTDPK